MEKPIETSEWGGADNVPSAPPLPRVVADLLSLCEGADLLSLREVAEALPGSGHDTEKITRWIRWGIQVRGHRVYLKAAKIKRQWFVRAADLRAFLDRTDRGTRERIHQDVYRAVRAALASGRLLAPDSCDLCGRSDLPIHLHHEDYGRPLWLLSLCSECHRTLHLGTSAQRAEKRRALAAIQGD